MLSKYLVNLLYYSKKVLLTSRNFLPVQPRPVLAVSETRSL